MNSLPHKKPGEKKCLDRNSRHLLRQRSVFLTQKYAEMLLQLAVLRYTLIYRSQIEANDYYIGHIISFLE